MLQSTPYDAAAAEVAALPGTILPGTIAVGATQRSRYRAAPARDVTEEDWHRAVELLRVSFNGGPSWFGATPDPKDHLVWKLVDFPHPARAYFAEHQGDLLGFTATLARSWLVRGEPKRAMDIVDAALHPSMQGRVLMEAFRSLRREFETWRQTDFSFGFASHPASLRNRGFQGKEDLGQPLDTLVRPLDLFRYVRHAPPRRALPGPSRTRVQIELERRRRSRPAIARYAAWQGRMLRHRLRRPVEFSPLGSFDVLSVEAFDERIDAFFERAASAFDFIQVRDRTFLNWRYADPRAGAFDIRVAETDGKVLGYAVLRTSHAVADLADVLVLPGRLDVAHALVRDSITRAREQGAIAMRTWMLREHSYYAPLASLGFFRVRTSTKPVFHAGPEGDPDEIAFLGEPDARVHLMLGDSDHV